MIIPEAELMLRPTQLCHDPYYENLLDIVVSTFVVQVKKCLPGRLAVLS
jgi:hypothetical protein